MFDVFVSYRHQDAENVRPLVDALRARGLAVWFDEADVESFGSIQHAIEQGLSLAKALLAYYSAAYPESLPCQWELTRAFVAGEAEGDPRRRVLLINPEPANTHIHPIQLRDARFLDAPRDEAAVAGAADAIADHVRTLSGTFGDVGVAPPRWFGAAHGIGSNRFFGRLAELWAIHSGLWSADVPVISSRQSRPLVRATGIGGSGKSLAAEMYAIRFGAAYPGGIFWLRAYGHDAEHLGSRDDQSLLDDQLFDLCEPLGISTTDLTPAQIRQALADRLAGANAYLWVVDDLPSGLSWRSVEGWLAPSDNGRTLITTRSDVQQWAGTHVAFDALDPASAVALLTHARTPADAVEHDEAHRLADDLKGHPLALELAAVAVQKRGFAEFRAQLDAPSRDALDFAAALLTTQSHELPHREQADVNLSTTLLRSVEGLDETAKDFLRLAAQLASTAIPRRLVVDTIQAADRVDPETARDVVDLAAAAVVAESLARELDHGNWIVHTLVSRAMRFRDANHTRREQLRSGAVAAAARLTDDAIDVGRHGGIADMIDHARALADSPLLDQRFAADDAYLLDNLYIFDRARGNYEAAERGAERLWKASAASAGADHPATLTYRSYLGEMRRAHGDLRAALAIHTEVFEARQRVLGQQHTDTVTAASDVARIWYEMGELSVAGRFQQTVLHLRRQAFGDAHPATLTAMNNLATTLADLGHWADALELQTRVVDGRRRALGEDDPETLQATGNLAIMTRASGDLAGAKTMEETVLARTIALFGEDHPDTAYSWNNLAVTLHAMGDVAGARRALQRALEIRRRRLGEQHPLTLATMSNLAAC